MSSTDRDQTTITALLRERAEYVARADDGRVAEVDEQLRLNGFDPEREALTWTEPPAPTRVGCSVAWVESGLR